MAGLVPAIDVWSWLFTFDSCDLFFFSIRESHRSQWLAGVLPSTAERDELYPKSIKMTPPCAYGMPPRWARPPSMVTMVPLT